MSQAQFFRCFKFFADIHPLTPSTFSFGFAYVLDFQFCIRHSLKRFLQINQALTFDYNILCFEMFLGITFESHLRSFTNFAHLILLQSSEYQNNIRKVMPQYVGGSNCKVSPNSIKGNLPSFVKRVTSSFLTTLTYSQSLTDSTNSVCPHIRQKFSILVYRNY